MATAFKGMIILALLCKATAENVVILWCFYVFFVWYLLGAFCLALLKSLKRELIQVENKIASYAGR